MDCRTALEILEVVRPDSEDLDDRKFASATTHLAECPQCTDQFRNLQEFDRQIGQVLRDVPVPTGLKEKLLSEMQLTCSSPAPSDQLEHPSTHSAENRRKQTSVRPVSRRRYIRYSVSAVVCLMAGFAVWMISRPEPDKLTVEKLCSLLDDTDYLLNSLSEFDRDFEATRPTVGWQSGGVVFSGPVHGFQRDRTGKHMTALFEFRFGGREASPQRGILIVVPLSSVENPPEASDFRRGTRKYDPVLHVSWKSKGLVYICLIPGGDIDSFDLLKRALQSELA